MTAGKPPSSQAIADTGRRELPGEWGGAAPAAARAPARHLQPEGASRRLVMVVRKP